MSSDLQKYIKEVNTYANAGDNSFEPSPGLLSKDKIFLPGAVEIGFAYQDQYETESNQKEFPIFTGVESVTSKKLSNGKGDVYYWWTRSPRRNSSQYFVHINIDISDVYGVYRTDFPRSSFGICFCFNI